MRNSMALVLAGVVAITAGCASDRGTVDPARGIDLRAVAEDDDPGWLVPDHVTVWSVDDRFVVAVPDGQRPFAFDACVAWDAIPPTGCADADTVLAPASLALPSDHAHEFRVGVPEDGEHWLLRSNDQPTSRDARVVGATTRHEMVLSPQPWRGDYEIRELLDGTATLAAFGLCRPDATSHLCTGGSTPETCEKDAAGTTRCRLQDGTLVNIFLGLLHRTEASDIDP